MEFSNAWLRLYFGLFHESAVLNFLELLLYHETMAEVGSLCGGIASERTWMMTSKASS